MEMHLYITPPRKRQDLSKSPKITIPNQSMSLKEILRRFVRREALPIAREGTYEHRMGDLEKLKNADIVDQMERVSELKANIQEAVKRKKQHDDNEVAKEVKRKADESMAAKKASDSGDSTTSPTP